MRGLHSCVLLAGLGTTMRVLLPTNGFQLTVCGAYTFIILLLVTSNMTQLHSNVDKNGRDWQIEENIGNTLWWEKYTTAGLGSLCGAWRWCWWVGGGVRKVRGVAQYEAKVRPPCPTTPLLSSPQPSPPRQTTL